MKRSDIDVEERFLRYVKIDTSSSFESETHPTTKKQFDLAYLLKKECEELGLSDIKLDENCQLTATLESNLKDSSDIPVIGFITHMDTSPDASGKDVKPIIHKNYDGKDIILNKEKNMLLKVSEFPSLKKYIGNDIITTDGTTLLGSDDKSGIAEVLAAVKYLKEHEEIPRGKIRIAFTPDEEVGSSMDTFNVKDWGCKYSYTMDGGEIGELNYETFNAASASLNITGRNIHPGYAKDKMANAVMMAIEFQNLLPKNTPVNTEGREGYYHLNHFNGDVNSVNIKYILRDHERKLLEEQKQKMREAAEIVNKKYENMGGKIELKFKDNYQNMGEIIEKSYDPVVSIVIESMKSMDIKPIIEPIRGGTDGARLSFMGVPCPNIFAGGENFHSITEYVPIDSMVKATFLIVRIIENYVKKFKK